jgi:hypothetical protein
VSTPSSTTILASKHSDGQNGHSFGKGNGHLEQFQVSCTACHNKMKWKCLDEVFLEGGSASVLKSKQR